MSELPGAGPMEGAGTPPCAPPAPAGLPRRLTEFLAAVWARAASANMAAFC